MSEIEKRGWVESLEVAKLKQMLKATLLSRQALAASGGLSYLTLGCILCIPLICWHVLLLCARCLLHAPPVFDRSSPLPPPGPRLLIFAPLSRFRHTQATSLEMVKNPQTNKHGARAMSTIDIVEPRKKGPSASASLIQVFKCPRNSALASSIA